MTQPDLLRDDCSRCAALCCMAPAFDAGPSFALDKPAGTPCPYLRGNGRCRIHDQREQAGFSGCIRFSCDEAGQRVTQDCFGGQSWRKQPQLAVPMMLAFQKARRIHGWLLLLHQAKKLPLSSMQIEQADELTDLLTPHGGRISEDWLDQTDRPVIEKRVMTFLTSLRETALRRAV